MKKQITFISVVIALMLLATMHTASSDTNADGKVWSDGYIELTLNKFYRTETIPSEFISPFEEARPPRPKHDYALINFTLTSIEGRHVLVQGEGKIAKSFLFDAKGDEYTGNLRTTELKLRGEGG